MKKWDRVYSKKFGGTWYPNEGVIRFAARFIKRRVGINAYEPKKQIKRILDAGCGSGRHIIFFAEQGINVYGIDISKDAIEIGNAWLAQKKLKADLRVGDIKELPFGNNFFDAVISFGVLDHITLPDAEKAIKEIKRVLIPKGYLFLTLRSVKSSEYGRGKKIAKNTYVLKEGYEKGITQHYFDLGEIKTLLKEFKIFDIELCEQSFPDIFTLDKAFLQSSKGVKKYINLTKPMKFNLRDSRWYIAAEKKQ